MLLVFWLDLMFYVNVLISSSAFSMSPCKLFRLFWYIVFSCLSKLISFLSLSIYPIVSLYRLSFYIFENVRYRSVSGDSAFWWTWALLLPPSSIFLDEPHFSSGLQSHLAVLIQRLVKLVSCVFPTHIFWYNGQPLSAFFRSESVWCLKYPPWSSENVKNEAFEVINLFIE